MKSGVEKPAGCEHRPNQNAEDSQLRVANSCQGRLSARIVADETPASRNSSQARSAAVTLRRRGETDSAKSCCPEANQFGPCQWERIFNSVGSGLRLIDRSRQISHVNDAFCRLAGVTREETVGQFCNECFPTAACGTDDCVLERLGRGECLVDCETEIVLNNGVARVCKISAAPLKADNGELIGVVEVFQDVTDRKQAEIALQKSEELHRITLANISDAVFITDHDGLFTFICPNSDVIFGYSREQIAEMGMIRNLLGNDLFDMVKLDERSELQNIEVAVNNQAGEQRVLLVNVKRVSIHGGTILYSCRDITERVKAEQALREKQLQLERMAERAIRDREWKFRELVSYAPVGAFLTDTDGNCVYANEAWCTLAGMSVQEASGRGWIKALHPDDCDRVIEEWYQAALAGREFRLDYRFRRPSGEVSWIEGRAKRLVDQHGQATGHIGMIMDITERKRAEEEIMSANEALSAERALLENKNIALQEVMDQIQAHKEQTGQQLQANVSRIALPLLQLVSDKLRQDDQHLVKLLESALTDLMDPVTSKLEQLHSCLSPREIEVSNMIRRGFSSKQMASILNVSVHTISNQRWSIRRKLHIDDNKTNLQSYLKGL